MQDRARTVDADLIIAVADGDTGALRTLYERHSGWLSVRLMRRCHDVGAWLWGVAVHRLVSQIRRTHRRTEVPVEQVVDAPDPSAEERVLAGVEYGELGAALAALSPEMRAVVQATILDGLTPSEAAVLLGIPRNTVKSRLLRARQQLRRALVEGLP